MALIHFENDSVKRFPLVVFFRSQYYIHSGVRSKCFNVTLQYFNTYHKKTPMAENLFKKTPVKK